MDNLAAGAAVRRQPSVLDRMVGRIVGASYGQQRRFVVKKK